ncbi:nucleotidyltransferase domain-containing protein [Microlunatus speluncae]|uniref:nucleotidyltransferase domain-containing protein n=1 Tax=Microlunatus speluncae TaxID=2594267 RepID=UPI0012666269|nr:nucleotidyltransferase domain-containing protein [Microlunatus speluncae]
MHQLPSPYPGHPHAGAVAREIAQQGLRLLVQVGSGVHGTSIAGQDDRDEMGFCLEPPEYVIGLARVPAGERGSIRFEQFERHTAWDRDGGLRNRSGAGDLDVIVYSLRKWAGLAADGNPTVLLPLFVPEDEIVVGSATADEVRANAHRFASKRSIERFLGYLESQVKAMTGERSARTNRPELVAEHGYDTKFAMHAARLGVQGVEFATTRSITLPIPEPHRALLRQIRAGQLSLAETLTVITGFREQLERELERGGLPDEPDRPWIDAWLIRTYREHWAGFVP